MSITIRPITTDEFDEFIACDGAAFGHRPDEQERAAQRVLFEFDRSLAAFAGPRMVGTAGIITFSLTLPGLTTAPAAGVTYVGVLPTHRRRGILRALMDRQLADVRERGEPLAILYASESNIYGRFGYGLATLRAAISVERDRAAFARPPMIAGSFSLLDAAETADILPSLYERFRVRQPGAVNRSAGWWDLHLRDIPAWRGEGGPRFSVLYRDASGTPAGYADYRVKQEWRESIPGHMLSVQDLFGLDDAALAALWHYLLNIDLVGTVKAWNRPVDEPLRWLLAEPRRMRIDSMNDALWVRLVDVAAALAARRYAATGALVLEVRDPFRPANDGCYALEGGPDGAACRRTSAAPDLTLEAQDLGAVYLGGVPLSNLARAGRVIGHTSSALARADALFACTPAPWSTTMF